MAKIDVEVIEVVSKDARRGVSGIAITTVLSMVSRLRSAYGDKTTIQGVQDALRQLGELSGMFSKALDKEVQKRRGD